MYVYLLTQNFLEANKSGAIKSLERTVQSNNHKSLDSIRNLLSDHKLEWMADGGDTSVSCYSSHRLLYRGQSVHSKSRPFPDSFCSVFHKAAMQETKFLTLFALLPSLRPASCPASSLASCPTSCLLPSLLPASCPASGSQPHFSHSCLSPLTKLRRVSRFSELSFFFFLSFLF